MDFKSLISKIESIDGPIETPKAPEQAAPIRLDEDTEMRVLAGVTLLTESVIAEKAVSKAQQKFMGMVHATQKGEKAPSKDVAKVAKEMGKKDAKDFASTKHKGLPEKKKKDESLEVSEADERKPSKQKEREVTLPSGAKVKARTVQGWQSQKADKESDKQKDESIDVDKFKAKFTKMVEAKKAKKDYDGDGKVESGKDEYKGAKDKAIKKAMGKKVEEAAKPDFLDIDKDGNKKEPMKKASADKGGDKKDGKKGMSEKQKKFFGKKDESVKNDKQVVAESVEQKLSLKDMLRIVKESGGQQQIDPVDQALWTWANRVAGSKIQESQKAEIFAAMIYERNGGTFEMYDVLSEDQK